MPEEMDLYDEIKKDSKNAEDYLLHYSERLAEYQEKKEAYLFAETKPGGAGRGNLPGKPTESRAIKSADYDLENPDYLWLRAVEYAERITSPRKKLFIYARRAADKNCHGNAFGRGRRAWFAYCQKKYSELTEDEFGQPDAWLSHTALNAWWHDLINLVVRVHDKLLGARAIPDGTEK